ncbi:MAG: aspartyl protease family protein [Bacteroidetes bacterium]|nr:aspartyl protease family protein [Bacteroidota bacterium]
MLLWALIPGFCFAAGGPDPGKMLPKDSLLSLKSSQHHIQLAYDPIVSSDSTSVIPFSRAGNLILIAATIDSVKGNFILDTGAPGLVLNLTYFRHYPQTHSSDQEQAGVSGGAAGRIQTEINELRFGRIKYHKVEADLVNLGQIENSKGIKILGLLGIELFRQCEMIIDYEKSLLYLHLISKKETRDYQSELLKDTAEYSIFHFDITENKIITKLEIAGKKLRFIIDCGAETNLLDSRLPDKIFENVTLGRRVKITGAGDGKTEALYGNLNNMKVGSQAITNLPVLITNLEKSCLSYISCTDGILGFDFLSLHKIGFNFVKRKMYIWK